MTGTGTSHAEKYQWIKKKTKNKGHIHTSCMRKTPYAPNYVNKVEN